MKVGRPDILTKERHENAVTAYLQGASHHMAADCIGISLSAIKIWIKRGEADFHDEIESKFVNFMTDIKQARYNYEQKLCKSIEDQGLEKGAWQAMAWLLERRNPDAFGRNAEELRRTEELQNEINELKNLISDKFNLEGEQSHGCSNEES